MKALPLKIMAFVAVLTLLVVHPLMSCGHYHHLGSVGIDHLVQHYLDPDGIFFHLQYGFLILAAWLFGWRSILIMVPVAILACVFVGHEPLTKLEVALLYAVLLVTAPTVFSLFQLGTDHAVPFDRVKLHWRFLVSGGLLSAVLCTALSAVIFSLTSQSATQFWVLAGAMGGKIAGLFLTITLLWLIFLTVRPLRRTAPIPQPRIDRAPGMPPSAGND